jgi:hypothetical protein
MYDIIEPESTILTQGILNNQTYFGYIEGLAQDGESGVDYVLIKIMRQADGYYWNGASWQVDEVWLVVAGQDYWAYNFDPQLYYYYEITSMAVDKAGNRESTPDVKTFVYIGDMTPEQWLASGISTDTEHSRPPFCSASIIKYSRGIFFAIVLLILAGVFILRKKRRK